MKHIIMIVMSLILFSCSSNARQQDAGGEKAEKVVVAYFSCTGNTERVARAIAAKTGAGLYRITPQTAYTEADLDWRNEQSRSSVEMKDEKSRPALGGKAFDAASCKVLFLGYPIWWNLCPRVINSFIEKYGLKGMTVIPFATSGSSSITNSVDHLKRQYPDIRWTGGRLCNGDVSEAADWAEKQLKK